EKFGLWPGTQEWVWGEGWCERFLDSLESNGEWLEPVTLAQAAAALPPTDRVYLPTASYFEMEHWALPPPAQHALDDVANSLREHALAESARPFLHGATWRSFLARYPEAARLEQRMVRTSELTAALGLRPADGIPSLKALHPAVRALFRGQC